MCKIRKLEDLFYCVCALFSPFSDAEAVVVAELLLTKYQWNVNTKNDVEWTPLYYAARRTNARLLRLLVKHGADINHQTKHEKDRFGK